jgi:pimeloyl-ACP methyl ester carboxylesterase
MSVLRVFGIFLLLVLLVILVGPLVVPLPPLEGTLPPEQLADPDSRFIDINGLTVHYKEAGQGEPALILLHGFGSSEYTWKQVMPELSQITRVVAYDRPAFGLTERPLKGEWTGLNPYGPEAQVQLVIDLMDSLGIQRAILVGNSAGGTVAAATTLAHSDLVIGLVLVDPAIYTGGGAPSLVRPLLNTPQADRIGPVFARAIRDWGENLITQAWHNPSLITEEMRAAYRRPLQVDNWDKGLWQLTKVSRTPDLPQRLSEFQLPVLVITGDDDRIVPTEQTVQLAGELPNAELVVLEACGHVPQEECSQAWLEAVIPYVQTQLAAGGN